MIGPIPLMHSQQQLVLLRLNPVLLRGYVAKMQKLSDLSAKLRQIAISIWGQIADGFHKCIVTRYNIYQAHSP